MRGGRFLCIYTFNNVSTLCNILLLIVNKIEYMLYFIYIYFNFVKS